MTIYLDIIFIENLLMNYIILFATGFITKENMRIKRLITSGSLGAIYAILAYLKIIPIYSNIFMKILLSSVMIYIAFNPQNVKKMCKELLLFYLTSFVIGGCAFALLYMISPKSVIFKDGVLVGMYPLKVTIIAGIIGFIIIQIAFNQNKKQLKKKDLICNIQITINKKTCIVKAYIDSGNTLKDPITGNPVIIVENKKINSIIDIQNIIGGDIENKFRIIPFKSIGNMNGVLYRNTRRFSNNRTQWRK